MREDLHVTIPSSSIKYLFRHESEKTYLRLLITSNTRPTIYDPTIAPTKTATARKRPGSRSLFPSLSFIAPLHSGSSATHVKRSPPRRSGCHRRSSVQRTPPNPRDTDRWVQSDPRAREPPLSCSSRTR